MLLDWLKRNKRKTFAQQAGEMHALIQKVNEYEDAHKDDKNNGLKELCEFCTKHDLAIIITNEFEMDAIRLHFYRKYPIAGHNNEMYWYMSNSDFLNHNDNFPFTMHTILATIKTYFNIKEEEKC